MKKLLLFLLLLLPTLAISQDSLKVIQDKLIVGIVKVYYDKGSYYVDATYADTSRFKNPVEVYNVIAEAYIFTFPFVYPQEMFDLFRMNVERFWEIYKIEN